MWNDVMSWQCNIFYGDAQHCVCWTTLNVIYWLIFSVRMIREFIYISPSSVPTLAQHSVIIHLATITFIISDCMFEDHIEFYYITCSESAATLWQNKNVAHRNSINYWHSIWIKTFNWIRHTCFPSDFCMCMRCVNEWKVRCWANYLCK